MRAVMREVPEQWLEERARHGHDVWDELWEGVLHMVPPPSFAHQRLGSRLLMVLGPHLGAKGIETLYETGVYRPGSNYQDYRVPDLLFLPANPGPGLITPRGVEGGPLAVVELRSTDDETYEKRPFYAALGVREVIVIDPPTRAVEVFRLAGGTYFAVGADDRGRLHAATLDVRFETVAGALRVDCAGASADL